MYETLTFEISDHIAHVVFNRPRLRNAMNATSWRELGQVFDRIRENRGRLAHATPAIINDSINQTFSRTVLTSLTTFFGLFPMILETSMQARFLIPMAISLGFGVLLSTFTTLILVPVSYAVLEDIRGLATRILGLETEDFEGDMEQAA